MQDENTWFCFRTYLQNLLETLDGPFRLLHGLHGRARPCLVSRKWWKSMSASAWCFRSRRQLCITSTRNRVLAARRRPVGGGVVLVHVVVPVAVVAVRVAAHVVRAVADGAPRRFIGVVELLVLRQRVVIRTTERPFHIRIRGVPARRLGITIPAGLVIQKLFNACIFATHGLALPTVGLIEPGSCLHSCRRLSK